MSFTSLTFVLFAIVAIAALRFSPHGPPKKFVTLLLNAVFLTSFLSSPIEVIPLLAFVSAGFLAIRTVRTIKIPFALAIFIALFIGAFAWLKQYPLFGWFGLATLPIMVIGLSYILFRILHLLIDVAQGTSECPPIIDYFCYVLFFLNLVSGPIQRYEDFASEMNSPPVQSTSDDIYLSIHRIVLGYFMIVVMSTIATEFMDLGRPMLSAALVRGGTLDVVRIYSLLISVYLLNIFANFAGYMHVIIGIGGLAGIRVPENFNHPLAAKNLGDLWARWHMTLSSWLKTYLFNPLLKTMVGRWSSPAAAPYLGAIAFFVTFLVVGFWHGTTFQFFVYGVVMGIGITSHWLWQHGLSRRMGKKRYRELCARPWYYELSRAATLSFFAVAMTCIWISSLDLSRLFEFRNSVAVVVSFAFLTVAGAAFGGVWDSIRDRLVARVSWLGQGRGPLRLLRAFEPWILCAVAGALLEGAVLEISGATAASSITHSAVTIGTFTALFTAALVAGGVFDPPMKVLLQGSPESPNKNDALAVWLGLRIFIVLNFQILLASAVPTFIYRAF